MTKTGRKNPETSARLKALWADPEWRARQLAKNPLFLNKPGSRKGTPDGMRREEAQERWADARKKADGYIKMLEDEGRLPQITVPDSDEDKAKEALREAFTIGLGPYPVRERMTALKTVLEFTKQKPVQKIDQKISSAEEWLDQVLKEDDGTPGPV